MLVTKQIFPFSNLVKTYIRKKEIDLKQYTLLIKAALHTNMERHTEVLREGGHSLKCYICLIFKRQTARE